MNDDGKAHPQRWALSIVPRATFKYYLYKNVFMGGISTVNIKLVGDHGAIILQPAPGGVDSGASRTIHASRVMGQKVANDLGEGQFDQERVCITIISSTGSGEYFMQFVNPIELSLDDEQCESGDQFMEWLARNIAAAGGNEPAQPLPAKPKITTIAADVIFNDLLALMSDGYSVFIVDATDNNVNVALPPVSDMAVYNPTDKTTARLTFLRIDSSENTATITPDSETINGDPELELVTLEPKTIVCDGENWWIV